MTDALLASYLLVGPGAWAIFLFGMIKGRKRMNLLKRPTATSPGFATSVASQSAIPSVCILVPVKDEAATIRTSIESIRAQTYANFHIVAIDDRSTDGTSDILNSIEGIDVLHIAPNELPNGWAGKPHALYIGVSRGVRESDAWLLFVDSDVTLAPDALAATIELCEQKRYDLLSLLPRFECHTFWERLLIPLCGAATSAMYLLPFTNYNELPKIAFANGQFLCIRRSAYEAIGGHESVRGTFSEDIAIARMLKRAGFRPRISNGEAFASTRMYDSLAAIMHGWSRNFFSGSMGRPWRILGAMMFVIVCGASALVGFTFGFARNDATWIIPAIAHLTLILTALALIYHWTGNSIRYAFAFPLGALMLMMIWLRALKFCITRKVEWRGTTYAYQIGTGVASR